MMSDKETLKKLFSMKMVSYSPDWKKITETNQFPGSDDEEAYAKKLTAFCEAIRQIRKVRNLSVEEMGARLNYSRQYIYEIEKNKIKLIPTHKFDTIQEIFGISPAYLLGLIEKEEEVPDRTQCYFWEYPSSEFDGIKEELIKNSLTNPMCFSGPPSNELPDDVTTMLVRDYELLYALLKICKTNSEKRNFIFDVVKNYAKLL